MKLKILYEDEYIIVCNKPSGVSSQTERGFDPDMVSLLMNHLHDTGAKHPYVGIIHRLDKPVSGIMVYAKTKEAAGILSKQLADNGFNKKYYAIVLDQANHSNESYKGPKNNLEKQGTLEHYLLHNVKNNSSAVVEVANNADLKQLSDAHNGAKLARLNYMLINQVDIEGFKLALLDIELLTGRHHQIRVQLSHMGYPILGDMKYSKDISVSLPYKLKKTGLALCAYSLSFKHPKTNKTMSFTHLPEGILWKELIIK